MINSQLTGISNRILYVIDCPIRDHTYGHLGNLESKKALTKPSFSHQMLDRTALHRMSCSGTPANPLVIKDVQSKRNKAKRPGSLVGSSPQYSSRRKSRALVGSSLLTSLIK